MTDATSFARAYVEAAVFADCGPDDETSGAPWAPETDERFARDAAAFFEAHRDDIADYESETDGNAGHDLWFTRRGHGCGFWEYPGVPSACRLDAAAKALGDLDLYLGDDGFVYAA